MDGWTRNTTKAVTEPVYHYGAGRNPTRITRRVALVNKVTGERIPCEHHHGHKTVDAARACAIKMVRKIFGPMPRVTEGIGNDRA